MRVLCIKDLIIKLYKAGTSAFKIKMAKSEEELVRRINQLQHEASDMYLATCANTFPSNNNDDNKENEQPEVTNKTAKRNEQSQCDCCGASIRTIGMARHKKTLKCMLAKLDAI